LSAMLRGSVMDATGDPRPVLIRRANSARPLSAYILPLRSSHEAAIEQFLMRAKAIVLVVDPQPAQPPDPAMVRDILGLTLSEARLASLIGTGISPRNAAERLQISEGTARVVLKRIFAKLGVSRQGELCALITRLLLS
jgi:DNA-binding CsgD family transcriptional regulator